MASWAKAGSSVPAKRHHRTGGGHGANIFQGIAVRQRHIDNHQVGLGALHRLRQIGAFGPDDPRETGFRELFFQRPGAVFLGIDQKHGQRHDPTISAWRAFFVKPVGLMWLIACRTVEVG
ncbi:MAG TPA: hypothetical protein VLL04_07515 [Rhizomicrobium sp.]|nr:hypothetical protein [Rhizomicrobium sp.]